MVLVVEDTYFSKMRGNAERGRKQEKEKKKTANGRRLRDRLEKSGSLVFVARKGVKSQDAVHEAVEGSLTKAQQGPREGWRGSVSSFWGYFFLWCDSHRFCKYREAVGFVCGLCLLA